MLRHMWVQSLFKLISYENTPLTDEQAHYISYNRDFNLVDE